MGSGDSLKDWNSDSISSHKTQVRSPAVQKLQLQLAQALSASSLVIYLITSFSRLLLFFKVNRIPSRKKPANFILVLGIFITASSTSITKFIEFGKGHQKSRLTEKAQRRLDMRHLSSLDVS